MVVIIKRSSTGFYKKIEISEDKILIEPISKAASKPINTPIDSSQHLAKTETTPQTSFAVRLRLALAHSGITQGVLADWTGISQSTISSYVTGKVKEAGFVRSVDMARALGVNAEWLIFGEGEMLPAKNLTKDSEV